MSGAPPIGAVQILRRGRAATCGIAAYPAGQPTATCGFARMSLGLNVPETARSRSGFQTRPTEV